MTEFEVQVLQELRRIRELIERRDAGEPNLLNAIYHAVCGAELVRHAALPANRDLSAALEREFGREPNTRRIGKFLASVVGRPTDGFIAEPIGKERDGVIWRVQVCPTKHTLPVATRKDAVILAPHFDEGVEKCD